MFEFEQTRTGSNKKDCSNNIKNVKRNFKNARSQFNFRKVI